MTNLNVYFVNKKISFLIKVLGYMGGSKDVQDPDIKMYVPGKFVLGPFKKRSVGLVLQVERMTYDSSNETLDKYQEDLRKEGLEVVVSGNMPKSNLEKLSEQAREHANTKKNYYQSKEDMHKSMEAMMKYLKI